MAKSELDNRLSVRWRLVLGQGAERADARLTLNADGVGGPDLDRRKKMDEALGFVYDAHAGSGRADLSAPDVYVPRWLDLVRESFPGDIVTMVFRDALENRGLTRLLLEPEALATLEPDPRLIATLLSLKEMGSDVARGAIRDLVGKLVQKLERQIRQKMVSAVRQGLRRQPMPRGSYRSVDWGRTVRRNLKHYNVAAGRLVPERFYFKGDDRKSGEWHIILLVDQSGSMAESVVHAAVCASVMASVRALATSIILFGSEVVDASHLAHHPVDLLMSAQIGGGTDIAGAVAYALERVVKNPARTLLVMVTDLYEGGDEELLVQLLSNLNTSRCRTACVLGITTSGRSDYDERLAARLAGIGTPSFAASPEKLVDLVATFWGRVWPPDLLLPGRK